MEVIIDSEEVKISNDQTPSFTKCCEVIMEMLISKDRSIALCKINGQAVNTLAEADSLFTPDCSMEVETVSVLKALEEAVKVKCQELHGAEDACEQLVTDSLLEEPEELVRQWQNLCGQLKEQVGFIPKLGPLLTEEQINMLIEVKLEELNAVMKDTQKALSKADVVAFSDILELRLSAWIISFREFLETQCKMVETLAKEKCK
ncbi:MAG: hypothetical protein AAF984_09245 [Verrucomicrobiota bacterium]